MLLVSVTSNLHQPDISVREHDIFSSTVWYPILFTFVVQIIKRVYDRTAHRFHI
jgi:hypothetical protein